MRLVRNPASRIEQEEGEGGDPPAKQWLADAGQPNRARHSMLPVPCIATHDDQIVAL